jgi:hypothetical protein
MERVEDHRTTWLEQRCLESIRDDAHFDLATVASGDRE